MHQNEMLALPQIGIHRLPREGPSFPTLAFLRSLQGVFEPRTRIGVVENLPAALDHSLIDDFGHNAEIIEGVHGMPGLAPGEISARAAAILGRTGLVAIHAIRIVSL